MIISCPSCQKKFEVDSNLIPEKGRILKCGSCDHNWFFKKTIKSPEVIENNYTNLDQSITKLDESISKLSDYSVTEKDKIDLKNVDTTKTKKKEITTKKTNKENVEIFSFSKILSFLIVLIISLIALVLLLDTFKLPLNNIFPELELLLFNLFKTLEDIFLFIKNLLT